MLRAKPLLASIMVVTSATALFLLHSDHDGFTPASKSANAAAPTKALSLEADLEASSTDTAIARLPRLANKPAMAAAAEPELAPTVITIPESTSKKTEAATLAHGTEEDAKPLNTSVASLATEQEPASLATAKPEDTATQPGLPLPIRAPRITIAGTSPDLLNSDQEPLASDDGVLTSPEITQRHRQAILRQRQIERARRRAQRLRARKRQQVTQAAPTKVSLAEPQQQEIAPKPKPLTHRKPFDSNRN